MQRSNTHDSKNVLTEEECTTNTSNITDDSQDTIIGKKRKFKSLYIICLFVLIFSNSFIGINIQINSFDVLKTNILALLFTISNSFYLYFTFLACIILFIIMKATYKGKSGTGFFIYILIIFLLLISIFSIFNFCGSLYLIYTLVKSYSPNDLESKLICIF